MCTLTSLPKDSIVLILLNLKQADLKRIRFTCKYIFIISKSVCKLSAELPAHSYEDILDRIQNLEIEEICFSSFFTTKEIIQENKLNISHIKKLPPTLKSLDFFHWQSFVDDFIPFIPPSIEYLDISGTAVTDEGMKYLPPKIQTLILEGTKVTEEGLKLLPISITYLDISNTQGINCLKSLVYLTILALVVSHLTRLNSLIIFQSQVRKVNLLPNSLKTLKMRSTFVKDKDLQSLPRSLESLCISHCPVSSKVIEYLPLSLVSLDMNGCNLEDSDLEYFSRFTKLSTLKVTKNNITEEGIQKFYEFNSLYPKNINVRII